MLVPGGEMRMMKMPPGAFVTASGAFTCEVGGKVIQGHQCHYHRAGYHDGLFDQFSIPFPALLRNARAKRRSEYLAGRFCAQQLLQRLGLTPARSNVPIGTSRQPIWPQGVLGSISHLEHRAVSVATTDAGVLGLGVDIEQEIPVEIAAGIRQEIVDAEEDALLRSYFEAYHRGLTVVFSGKESVYKAAHRLVGRSFDFASMRLVRVDANQMVFSVAEALCERLPVGVELRVNYTLLGREVFTIACLTPQDADHNSPDRAWGDFPDFLRNRDLGRTDQQRCSHRR